MAGLVVSGVTAFPLQTELGWIISFLHRPALRVAELTWVLPWMERVYDGLSVANARYPFLAYG